MMIQDAVLDRQPCLFETLPATEPRRRLRRSNLRTAPEIEGSSNPVALPPAPPPPPTPTPLIAVRVDAAALTNPELSDLVRALSDASLAFLLGETVRETRRRLAPDCDRNAGEDGEGEAWSPAPPLLRAARAAVIDLTETE